MASKASRRAKQKARKAQEFSHGQFGEAITSDEQQRFIGSAGEYLWCEIYKSYLEPAIKPGHRVRIRKDVKEPKYGWGNFAKSGELGVVESLDEDGDACVVFPSQKLTVYPPDLEVDDGSSSPLAGSNAFVLEELKVPPFVGPVHIGLSPGRGRGLFASSSVRAGELIFAVAAVATGSSDALAQRVFDRAKGRPAMVEAVLSLSRGPGQSEAAMPVCSTSDLADPSTISDVREGMEQEFSQAVVSEALRFNQFSLPRVDPHAEPVEVTNDTTKSGLWLLPSFLNHSCRPNVQRVIVKDMFFLRAARDLHAGDEFFECYVETLRPLEVRRRALVGYGIALCECERCMVEALVLGDSGRHLEAQHMVSMAAGKGDQAKAAVDDALSRCMPGDGDGLPDPAFGKDRVRKLLLAGFANVDRAQAARLGEGQTRIGADSAWASVLDILDEVLPCSELSAAASSELLSAELFVRGNLEAIRPALRRSLCTTHLAYGGGAPVWSLLNHRMFGQKLLDAAVEEWASLELERGITKDGISRLAAIPSRGDRSAEHHAPNAVTENGMTFGMEGAVEEHDCNDCRSLATANGDILEVFEHDGCSALEDPRDYASVVDISVQSANIIMRVLLPGLHSVQDISLEVAEFEVKIRSLRQDCPHALDVSLPERVDAASGGSAKWSRRTSQLTVRLTRMVCAT